LPHVPPIPVEIKSIWKNDDVVHKSQGLVLAINIFDLWQNINNKAVRNLIISPFMWFPSAFNSSQQSE
jgi:hypothetical protein